MKNAIVMDVSSDADNVTFNANLETGEGIRSEIVITLFLDDRYVRIDDKPVFLFYSPNDISCLHKMVLCWRQLTDRKGLNGLYLIGANINAVNMDLDATIISRWIDQINKKVCAMMISLFLSMPGTNGGRGDVS